MTYVTESDQAVEAAIRRTLKSARGRDIVLGEEQGEDEGTGGPGGRRWIIDPIDGTSNFVRGVPVWATLIALEEDGEIVAGCVSAPALGRRWWASKGTGAYTGKSLMSSREIHVSQVSDLESASLSYASLGGWDAIGKRRGVRGADAALLAHPRVRRLLVVHAARRGRRRHRGRARAEAVGHGGARHRRARGRRHVHEPRRRARPVGRQRAGHQHPAARRRDGLRRPLPRPGPAGPVVDRRARGRATRAATTSTPSTSRASRRTTPRDGQSSHWAVYRRYSARTRPRSLPCAYTMS